MVLDRGPVPEQKEAPSLDEFIWRAVKDDPLATSPAALKDRVSALEREEPLFNAIPTIKALRDLIHAALMDINKTAHRTSNPIDATARPVGRRSYDLGSPLTADEVETVDVTAMAVESSPSDGFPVQPATWKSLTQRANTILLETHYTSSHVERAAENGPSSVLVPPPATAVRPAAEAADVLRLDDGVDPWEALECDDVSLLGATGGELGYKKQVDALRIIDLFVSTAEPSGGPWSNATGTPSSSLSVTPPSLEVLQAIQYTLDRRPELLTQHAAADVLLSGVVSAALQATEAGISVAKGLYKVLPGRMQLWFVQLLLEQLQPPPQSVSSSSEKERYGESAGRIFQEARSDFLFGIIAELPQSWHTLVDSEVEELFCVVMEKWIFSELGFLEVVDPTATWLAQWCTRPAMEGILRRFTACNSPYIRRLKSLLPSSHTAAVLLLLLSSSFTIEVGELPPFPTISSTESRAVLLDVFHRLTRLFSSDTSLPPELYTCAADSLLRCLSSLMPSEQDVVGVMYEEFFTAVLTADEAMCPAQAQLLLQLLCFILLHYSEQQWMTAAEWQRVDGELSQRLDRLIDVADTDTPCVPASSLCLFWRQLLPRHWSSLPTISSYTVAHLLGTSSSFFAASSSTDAMSVVISLSSTALGWSYLIEQLYRHCQSSADRKCNGRGSGLRIQYGRLLRGILFFDAESLRQPEKEDDEDDDRDKSKRRRSDGSRGSLTARLIPMTVVERLLRWCSCSILREGLQRAARELCQRRLEAQDGQNFHERGEAAYLLPCPLEELPAAIAPSLAYFELTVGQDQAIHHIGLYQAVATLLCSAALPPPSWQTDASGDPGAASSPVLERILGQVQQLWMYDPPVGDGSTVVNCPPYGEDSLLYLLSAAVLLLLTSPAAEYSMWFDGLPARQRMRALRLFCQDRRGVDPVYFMIRFLTSGKGRKRLPAILIDGYEADLTVETFCEVSSFVDGESLPSGEAAATVTRDAVLALLNGSFDRAEKLNFSGEWPVALETLATLLLAHRSALREVGTNASALLSRQTAGEWLKFMKTSERACAVAHLLETTHPEACALLSRHHVDLVFLTSLCVGNWLSLPLTHTTTIRRKLFCTSFKYFAANGTAAWESFVAQSMVEFVLKVNKECLRPVDNSFAISPLSRSLLLPSPLFAFLLVRPFTLASTTS